MVKSRGGLKRKIPIEKIEKKTSRGPCYSKRCNGLFGKASQFCLLSGAQIAVLATPMSENSNVSFFSFGHSSVDTVVSAFLAGKRPLAPSDNKDKHMREDMGVCLTRKALGLGFWWENEALTSSQNLKELSDAVDSMSKLLKHVKDQTLNIPLYESKAFVHTTKNKTDHDLVSHHETREPDQTLTTPRISDDFLEITDSEIMAYYQGFCITNNNNDLPAEENLDQTLTTDDYLQNMDSEIMAYPQDFSSITDNNKALADDTDMDYDQLIDFETSPESLLSYGVFASTQELEEFAASLLTSSDSHDSMDPSVFSGSEPVKEGDFVLQNRGFSFNDFNELPSLVTL